MISGTALALRLHSPRRVINTHQIVRSPSNATRPIPLIRPRARVITEFNTDSSNVLPSNAADPEHVQQGTPLHAAELKSCYDAIVVGSGMGGLAAAVGLAKFGQQQVLVLEQHYTAGGFTHAFKRGKYAWNVGVHYLGGVGKHGSDFQAAFDAFTDGQVAWAKLPDVRERLVIGDRVYDIMTGKQAWLDKMTEYFPEERQALLRFLDLTHHTQQAFKKANSTRALPGWLSALAALFTSREWADLSGRTLAEVLDGLTQNQELKAVLAGSWPDVGLPPQSCSAGYYLNMYEHFLDGAYIPAHGANSIAAAMIPAVEAAGGAVVTSADVSQILVKDGKATGVRLRDGREISARVVISNAGLINTYSHLLPQEVLASNTQLQQHLQQATTAGKPVGIVILYLGLDEPFVPEFEGLGTLRLYHSADLDGDLARFEADPEAPLPIVEICCCDAREKIMPDNPAGAAALRNAPQAAATSTSSSSSSSSSSRSGGVSTIQVMAFARYDWFKEWADTKWHKRGGSYEAFKHHLQDRLMQKLGEVFPNLPGRVAFSEVSTPLTTEHFSRWPQGAIYGISVTPERYRLTHGMSWGPVTPLPGLLLTGQDVVGDGVLAALLAGTLAARVAGGPGVSAEMMKGIKKWV